MNHCAKTCIYFVFRRDLPNPDKSLRLKPTETKANNFVFFPKNDNFVATNGLKTLKNKHTPFYWPVPNNSGHSSDGFFDFYMENDEYLNRELLKTKFKNP